MDSQELYYQIALSQVPGIGPVRFKKIIDSIASAKDIFSSKGLILKEVEGTPPALIQSISNFSDFEKIDNELKFTDKHNIKILSIASNEYPEKLKQCIDAPPILFFKGHANLNHTRVVSIIGTRLNTEYGKRQCELIIEQLKPYNVLMTSGLAFGIDFIAHKSCVSNQIPTVGVMACGLDKIYPEAHSKLAHEMMQDGGLLSEYFSNTKPNRENFPTRNRIVAGMADATIVIETDIKGGSMITAALAFGYNRDVYCIPGRISDSKSAGCLKLIKDLKGQLLTDVSDIANGLGWIETTKKKKAQRELFIELTSHEKIIYDILKTNINLPIDQLVQLANLNSSEVAGAVLTLEMQSIVQVMPGKLVSLI